MTPNDSQAESLHEELARVLALLACMPTEFLMVYDANEGDGWPPRPLWSLKNAAYDEGSEDGVMQASLNFGHKNDADALAACFNFLRKHGAHIAETFKETPNG